ncbi:hypothetical protein GFY24_04320 [Nocardia sp. SYP-A9097]|uniref:hypothetical protein n=1 Tax=Nocardia sp. SYP-A9097 TaxID=2663237 RepID=UPI00129ACFC6|nr:hypothetical protein [Nocardia sp. SYP-A9097]MRH86700.1 hypothetical protein [Nocardia sp. SYP-A9097]
MTAGASGTQRDCEALCIAVERRMAIRLTVGPVAGELFRVIELLGGVLRHSRTVAGVWELDPTLADELPGTERMREIEDFLALARRIVRESDQICPVEPTAPERRRRVWGDLTDLLIRAELLAERIVRVVPRRHDTDEGSREISRLRLATHADTLVEAALLLRSAVREALRVPTPDADALRLAATADLVMRLAADLDAEVCIGTHQRI